MPLNFSLTVPDADRSRVLDAFAVRYGYQNDIPDGSGGTMPNPETRGQFAKRMVSDYIRQVVREAEVDGASRAAAAAAAAAPPPAIT